MKSLCLCLVFGATGCFSPDPTPAGDETDPDVPPPATSSSSTSTTALSASATAPDSTGSTGVGTGVGSASSGESGTGGTTLAVVETGETTTAAMSSSSGNVGDTSTGPIDTTRRVFVSSETYAPPDVADADTLCQELADDAVLGGTWIAWVSTSDVDARSKMTADAGPYVLLDGTEIAADGAGLGDGSIDAAIDIDEAGQPYESITAVWTGTQVDGTVADNTCDDWTALSSAVTGLRGNVTVTGNGWTQIASVACVGSARIYCFET